MINKPSRAASRRKRHYKMRRHLSGTAARPRLSVFKSNKYIYAQVIDDVAGHTLASASTMDAALVKEAKLASKSNLDAAKAVGMSVAKKAIAKGIESVVFDRAGYVYHGRVKALADAAREAGLAF
ncbi:MAG: 50S ribosomal protein L18 [Defluviitaleaceae bacterium]|nr:50S ribosomal protein L18 [Defluviitaleaceae bacterium]MCL2238810.1 50S ribosomal protein L18 [Defluviitaleaceae bacterium]